MAGFASALGLAIVIGNGVQTAIGKHLELLLHCALRLASAAECNGFLKIIGPGIRHNLEANGDGEEPFVSVPLTSRGPQRPVFHPVRKIQNAKAKNHWSFGKSA